DSVPSSGPLRPDCQQLLQSILVQSPGKTGNCRGWSGPCPPFPMHPSTADKDSCHQSFPRCNACGEQTIPRGPDPPGQTCSHRRIFFGENLPWTWAGAPLRPPRTRVTRVEIGRASCRERVESSRVDGSVKEKKRE